MGHHLLFALLLSAGPTPAPSAALVPQEAQETLSTDGAVIRFSAQRHGAGVRFLEVFSEVRTTVRAATGADLKEPVTIELVADHAELVAHARRHGGRDPDKWIDGLAFPGLRLILIRLDASGSQWHRTEGLLTHELTHVAVHEYADMKGAASVPRWFDEAVAQYVEGQPLTDVFWGLPLLCRVGALIGLDDLEEAIQGEGSRRAQAYVEAESFLHFVATAHGGHRLVRALLEELALGTPLDAAMVATTGSDLAQLEKRWRLSLRHDVGGTLRGLAPLGFAMFIALTTVVIMLRRERRRRQIERRWAQEDAAGWDLTEQDGVAIDPGRRDQDAETSRT